MPSNVALISLSLLATYLLCHAIRKWAHHKELMDVPNHRSAHQHPTPTSGGLAFSAVYAAGMIYLYAMAEVDSKLVWAVAGTIPVAILGYLDDIKEMPARLRFTCHIGAAGWAMYWLGGMPLIVIGDIQFDPGWAGYVFGVLYLAWLLNLFNFMDGIDGIAGSEAVFVLASVCLIATGVADDIWLLLAVSGGFLIINWPIAKLFMGDVGSGFLGLSLGILAIFTANNELISFWSWLILLGYFIVDASLTLLIRFLRGETVYEAHNLHAYQHASRALGDKNTLYITWLINLVWLLPLAWWVNNRPEIGLLLLLIAYAPVALVCYLSGSGQVDSKLARYPLK
jgi:Fuc2NAc and GlcNAc transferase